MYFLGYNYTSKKKQKKTKQMIIYDNQLTEFQKEKETITVQLNKENYKKECDNNIKQSRLKVTTARKVENSENSMNKSNFLKYKNDKSKNDVTLQQKNNYILSKEAINAANKETKKLIILPKTKIKLSSKSKSPFTKTNKQTNENLMVHRRNRSQIIARKFKLSLPLELKFHKNPNTKETKKHTHRNMAEKVIKRTPPICYINKFKEIKRNNHIPEENNKETQQNILNSEKYNKEKKTNNHKKEKNNEKKQQTNLRFEEKYKKTQHFIYQQDNNLIEENTNEFIKLDQISEENNKEVQKYNHVNSRSKSSMIFESIEEEILRGSFYDKEQFNKIVNSNSNLLANIKNQGTLEIKSFNLEDVYIRKPETDGEIIELLNSKEFLNERIEKKDENNIFYQEMNKFLESTFQRQETPPFSKRKEIDISMQDSIPFSKWKEKNSFKKIGIKEIVKNNSKEDILYDSVLDQYYDQKMMEYFEFI